MKDLTNKIKIPFIKMQNQSKLYYILGMHFKNGKCVKISRKMIITKVRIIVISRAEG